MKKLILISAITLFICITAFIIGGNKSVKAYVEKEDLKFISFSDKWGERNYVIDADTNIKLRFELTSRSERPVKKEILNDSKFLRDFILYYPVNWITTYDSVEIIATCKGKVMKAMSPTDALSNEQKNILSTVDIGTDIFINVQYKYKNQSSDVTENNLMHIKMTVVPYYEAEYIGGNEKMKNYLKESVINELSETTPKRFQKGIITFTIDEQGEIMNAHISSSSEDKNTDNLLLDAINKMPKWKPAENAKGIKVKQNFKFSIYNGYGGC